MHRFFVPENSITRDCITITGDDVNHISKVLRLRAGDSIMVCDGRIREYLCTITSIEKKKVDCSITERMINKAEPPIRVDLYQGIPKSSKMDIIVQKCTELGIDRITPVHTERVIVKTGQQGDMANKIARWRKIAEEAAKQSGRGHIPEILEPIGYDEVVERLGEYDMAIIPYEKENTRDLKHTLKGNNKKNMALLIGPEGGFLETEILSAEGSGAVPVTLGPRILRTETAGFACLSIIMYELGDMGGEPWRE